MALKVTYKGTDIIDETADCVKKLDTAGCYMEDDITIDYTGGTAPTLISKSITANGTYNASSDNADGYSSVTVNVPDTAQALINQTITSAVIPNDIATIRKDLFHDCKSLSSVEFASNSTCSVIDQYAFAGTSALTSITFPNSLKELSGYAFSSGALTGNIALPQGFERILNNVFQGCPITNIVLPSTVTTIGNTAFYVCNQLLTVKLSSSLQSIGNSCFVGCTKLTEVDCTELSVTNGNVNTTCGTGAFTNSNNAPLIFATQEIMEVYAQATNWSSFASRMTYVGAE